MPLLRRQPFRREIPPPDLHPDEEVFLCKITNEIFRDYEKFFERVILCNSLVWSCAITGRAGLTYQEAEECEEKALKQLATFPDYLQRPILYLANQTQRSRLEQLNDDVFVFAKDRFFIGETVEVLLGRARQSCKVVSIIPPEGAAINGDASEESGDEDKAKSSKKGKALKPEQYQYIIQEMGTSKSYTVKYKMVSRKKGLYTRDKSKLFLKQSCESTEGIWRVKEAKLKKFDIASMTFEDIFAGPPPVFTFSEIKKKPARKSEPKPESRDASPAPGKKKDQKQKESAKKPATATPPPEPKLTPEEIAILREQERLQKLEEKQREMEEKKKKWEEEKERRRKEKALEFEKKREEKRIQAEIYREWSKPREDLDCDDLKVLPEPTPVKSRIPEDQFGDAIMIVEFVNCFNSLFELKESFPKGFTLGVLEEALLETDAGGLMADLLLMMLTAVFSLEEEEEQEESELAKEEKDQAKEAIEQRKEMKDMSVNQLIEAATSMSHVPLLTHGVSLRKLPLDNFTLTEILRLHLLSSGAEANPGNAKFCYQQRGGYMPTDDAGLVFRRQEQEIIRDLGVENIYDLPPSDKLKILKVLVDQFLTYAATRDLIDDNFEKLRQVRLELKQLQWAEQRREREEAAARYKRRMFERIKEREKLEKKRFKLLKQKEQEMRKEAAKSMQNGDESANPDVEADKQAEDEDLDDDDDDEPIMTQEERERLQQEEDDAEADKKAEYMMKERDFIENIHKLQHGNAIYPLGRDRMYRRYWIFRSIQGVYVENDESYVDESALKPCSQNPNGSLFVNAVYNPPKLINSSKKEASDVKSDDVKTVENNKDGSDKENDSMNASGLNENIADANNSNLNVSSADSSLVSSANPSLANTPIINTAVQKLKDANGEDVIEISDDDDSRDKPPALEKEEVKELPPFIETAASKQITEGPKHKWAFFRTEEDIENLLNALNSRGYRESLLKSAIIDNKNKLVEVVTEVPEDLLNIPDEEMKENALLMSPKVRTKEWKQGNKSIKGQVKNDSAGEGLELNLRELLLDLEERIHVGGLGYLRVSDRAKWRDAIEQGSYEPCTDDPMFAKEEPEVIPEEDKDGKEGTANKKDEANAQGKDEEGMEVSEENGVDKQETKDSEDDNSGPVLVARDLAKALVQIQKGLEDKFLLPPFGEDEKVKQSRIKAAQEAVKREEQKKSKKKGEEDSDDDDEPEVTKVTQTHKSTLERWQESCLFSTSLSQVFLHLSTLEKAVTWAKSVLHTRCKLCRRKGDPEKMLLCDTCDRGHHMYCLKPPLKNVPKGDWFCPDCRPKETKRSPRKDRRRKFSQEESSDEEEEEEEESDDEAEDEASSEDDENDETCAVCGLGGTLICCDNCPLSYHLNCAQPPLKKVPKKKWWCQICLGEDSKTGKIKFLKAPKSKKGQKLSTPTGSRTSSKRSSPRDSPLTIKPFKKRRRIDSSDDDKPKLKRNAKSSSKLAIENKDEPKHYVSSSRGSSMVQQLKIIEDIVMNLMAEEDAWPFLKPVLKRDAPDYYEVIKIPMDFSTIKNKINKFVYVDPAEIVQDVRQIFTNCIEYNKRTTMEFKAGANLSKLFEKRLKDMEAGVQTNGPSKRARTK